MFETEFSTLTKNNKRNRVAVHVEQLRSELRAVVQGVILSNLEPNEIHDLFADCGAPLSQPVVSSLIRQRCEKQNARV